jgi:uncharacterized membrane protein
LQRRVDLAGAVVEYLVQPLREPAPLAGRWPGGPAVQGNAAPVTAFSWFSTVAGLFLFADVRRRRAFSAPSWWGGLLIGAGGFQLYDGTLQHKVMRLHQIRYGVDLAPYDWVWNIIAVALIIAGAVLLVRARRRHA